MVEGPPNGPEVVVKPSLLSGSGLETLPEVWKWSRDLPEVPEVVGRTSRRSGSGRKIFPEVRKRSGDPP